MSSSPSLQELLERNKSFASKHKAPLTVGQWIEKGVVPKICVVTCADPRCVPEDYFQLSPTDAVIMRTTAGAVAPVLYDILTLDATIGLEQVYIVHHSDCGGFIIDTAKVRASLVERAPGMKKEIEKASVPHYDDLDTSIRADVALFKSSPVVPDHLKSAVKGFAYDLSSGLVTEVE